MLRQSRSLRFGRQLFQSYKRYPTQKNVRWNHSESFHATSPRWLGVASFLGVSAATTLFWNYMRADSEAEVMDEETKVEIQPGTFIEGLPTFTKEDVSKHKSVEDRIWVYYKQGVYDITDFVELHPGGKQKISLAAGRSIEPFWALYAVHKNEEVYEILETWRIGNLLVEDSEETIDIDDPYAHEKARNPLLIINSNKPFNAEPPALLLAENFITPNELFFVRNHLPVPQIPTDDYKLEVHVGENQSVQYSLEDLKSKFSAHTITATIQCAGNRRDEMNEIKQIKGLRWTGSAISTACWKGVYLRDLLRDAGINLDDENLAHIQFEGLDCDETSCYGASIPIEKAMSSTGDVLIAYEMNGTEIPLDHGYPVRMVIPGHVGARNVKWLGKIVASSEESSSHWQRKDYKAFSPSADWDHLNWDSIPSIQELPVQSLICSPQPGTVVGTDEDSIFLKGYAWSGGGRGVCRVEVTLDDGESWISANLQHTADEEDEQPRYNRNWAWTLWSAHLPIPPQLRGNFTVSVRAVDTSYNAQPECCKSLWNVRGVVNNSWHKVSFFKE